MKQPGGLFGEKVNIYPSAGSFTGFSKGCKEMDSLPRISMRVSAKVGVGSLWNYYPHDSETGGKSRQSPRE